MDNKMNNMLEKFMKNVDTKNIDELNKKLQEFITQYNNGEIDYEECLLDVAYEMLEEAQNTKSITKAKKLAKEAYDMCPDCFDALLFLVHNESKALKRDELLEEGLKLEKTRLEKEGYFAKANIGEFYQTFQTRPYIRGIFTKADNSLKDGKYRQSIKEFKEVLRLNNGDNLGARYALMAIYALLEDEKEMLKLYKKYPEEGFCMQLPLFMLYYKLGDEKKANEYLKIVNKININFLKLFNGKLEVPKDYSPVYYQKGDVTEILMYLKQYRFLFINLPNIDEYIIKNLKK